MRDPERGEVEKVVGNRARVTASNNVFSPLCVLAARERAEGTGGGHAISILARVATPRGTALAYTPSAINFVNTACCGRDTRGEGRGRRKGDEKRVAVSPAAASCPLRTHSPCPSHFTRGAVDGFLRSNDGATPKSSRPFVSDSRSSFD